MNKIFILSASFLLLPLVASAQTMQVFIKNILDFINDTIIPFLFGIAFLFFVYNAFRFFILGGDNKEDQEKAKALAIYSVAAFVFLIVFWGIINVLSSSIGLNGANSQQSDYITNHNPPTNYPPDNDTNYELPGEFQTQ